MGATFPSSGASVARRQLDQARGLRVLLANLLQQGQRLGRDPGFVGGEELVELGNAERIGADRGHPRVLARSPHRVSPAAVAGLSGCGAAERGEGLELRVVVAGCEHERRILMQGGHLQHRGRYGPALAQRGDAALRAGADPAAQPSVHQPPRLERQRHGRPARDGDGSFAQLARQARGSSEQQEHGLLLWPLDLDRARPGGGARQPALHARVDPVDLELGDQLRDRFGVVLDGGQRKRRVGPVQRAQVAAAGKHAGERRVDGVDHDPVLPAPVAAQFDFV